MYEGFGDEFEFEGQAGMGPEEAANGVFGLYRFLFTKSMRGNAKFFWFGIVFDEETLDALGFHLEMLFYLWPKLKDEEPLFFLSIAPEFAESEWAMAKLHEATSYIGIPSERIKTREEILRQGEHGSSYREEFQRRSGEFLRRSAIRLRDFPGYAEGDGSMN